MFGASTRQHQTRLLATLMLACSLLLAACSGPLSSAESGPAPATPTATSIPGGEPAAREGSPTATLSPNTEATATPVPTATPTATAALETTPTEPPTVTPSPAPTNPPTATTAPEPDPTASPTSDVDAEFDVAEFQQRAQALLEGEAGLYSISARLPDGTVVFETSAGESMEAASLYKLAIMVEVFRQRELGELSFDDELMMYPGFFKYVEADEPFDASYSGQAVPVADLLYAMVTRSSNTAAWTLLDRVTNSRVNATMQALGLAGTEIRWMPVRDLAGAAPDEAAGRDLLTQRADEAWQVTTASDMARLFTLLLNGQAVGPEADREMLEMLADQTVNDRLPAYLPAGTVVAHKTGNLEGLVHDAGVIYTPTGPVAIAVLTEDAPNAWDVTAALGLAVYEAGS